MTSAKWYPFSPGGIWVNPCSVCTISEPADNLVQYGIGTAANTKVILLVMKIEWVKRLKCLRSTDQIIQWLHVDFYLTQS